MTKIYEVFMWLINPFIFIPLLFIFVIYTEIKFAYECQGSYHIGRPSLCISQDGRILKVR